jgi:hypothetical protein
MAETTTVFRINALQAWQRDAVTKAAQFVREKHGNPPEDEQARQALEGLLEVLDPARRTVRLQREISEATRQASLTPRTERRAKDRRAKDRRKVNLGAPPGTTERRSGERRAGKDRRNQR